MPETTETPLPPVTMISGGKAIAVPADMVDEAIRQGFTREDDHAALQRVTEQRHQEEYGGVAGGIIAAGAGGLRTVTGGLSDVAFRALGEGDEFAGYRDVHPTASLAGEIGGLLVPTGAVGALSKGAKAIRGAAEGAGVITQIARAGAGAAFEGAGYGLSSAVSELALSKDPLTIEHAASVVSSRMLFGGAVGLGAGLLTKVAEKGLIRAQGALEEMATRRAAADSGDLVAQRTILADDIGAYRAATNESKIFLATKDADVKGIGEIRKMAKVNLDADRQIDRALNKGTANMADNLRPVLGHLQQQENALTRIAKSDPELRALFAADATGVRMASLDAIPATLEKNQALQQRIIASMDASAAAKVTRPEGMIEKMVGGSAFGVAAGAVSAIPLAGPLLAPFAGAMAAKFATGALFGRMAKATAEVATRTSKAVGAFLDVSGKAMKAAPVLATNVLLHVAYAPAQKDAPVLPPKPKLADVYRARSDEIRSQVAIGPTGVPQMRRESRMAMATRLDPIRVVNPTMADRMESIAAARMEFLAGKLPRRPDLAVVRTGPDRWQPSDMEMRSFARYAAAVEDPGGIEERLAAGTITPEDAEVMRTVYPERKAEIVKQIVEKLPELRASLPYSRRLSLSIFSGVPVDAAMAPPIIRVLQAQFVVEPGSAGGMQAPTAQPQFGSVSKSLPEPTPGQTRSQG